MLTIRQQEAGTPGPTGMPAGKTATALTRRGPMATVSSHQAMATAVAFLHVAQAQSPSVARPAGLAVMVVGAVIVAVLAAFVRAARALSVMMAAFMEAVAAMTSVVFTVLVFAVIVGYILIHH
jgi:hypothetical protein